MELFFIKDASQCVFNDVSPFLFLDSLSLIPDRYQSDFSLTK